MEAAAVGTPVTRRPPHRPGRAVFPPPVPRLHSRPRRPCPFPVTPCLLWPAGRVAHTAPGRPVRAACPCRAACCRRDLPPGVGLPHRRVLRALRLPRRRPQAVPVTGLRRLPGTCAPTGRRCPPGAVSGLPLPCLTSCRPSPDVCHGQEPLGPPEFFAASLPACHGLRTPADLHLLASTAALVLPAVGVHTLGVRPSPCRSGPSPSGDAAPPTADRIRCLRRVHLVHRVTTAPPWTHDALRVGSEPLPDRDFHPARDAKLFLAQERYASGAGNSGSEGRADAIGRRPVRVEPAVTRPAPPQIRT
jgi:hypothetical protein